ncbi:MAG: hypothetical protein D6776_02550 [Planctomycetota bacterium]|nr:MAG: hypothetical protein D6776_02550 [Planctomycetota bacterium]
MDLETLWRNHRRALLVGGGGLLVLAIGLSIAGGIDAQARRLGHEAARLEQQVQDRIAELSGREGFERGLAKVLAERIGPRLRAELLHARRPAFERQEGESPYVAYGRVLELVEQHRAAARRKGVALPRDLGLERQPPEARIEEALAHADVLDDVLERLVAHGARTIEQLAPANPRYVALAAPTGEEGHGRESPRETGDGTQSRLRLLPVRFETTLQPREVLALLADLQAAGRALELLRWEVRRVSDTELALSAECAALALVSAKEVPRERRERRSGLRRWRRR